MGCRRRAGGEEAAVVERSVRGRWPSGVGVALVSLIILSGCGSGHGSVATQPKPRSLAEKIAQHALAPTDQVLDSQKPSVIVQFPLQPASIKTLFPTAVGVVTIVQGNPEVSLLDTVTVDVANMPTDTTFTIFLIEHATKPFGAVEYVADLHTDQTGTGEATFQAITLAAFAANAEDPGTSKDQTGDASGIQLEHLGMWFSQLDDAKKILKDDTVKGTPFDGGNPPLHAGPQAMNDGQTDPVF
jgi:hypothetical protein